MEKISIDRMHKVFIHYLQGSNENRRNTHNTLRFLGALRLYEACTQLDHQFPYDHLVQIPRELRKCRNHSRVHNHYYIES